MKKLVILGFILCGLNVWANTSSGEEILYNETTQRSVLDMATDPQLKIWERSTYLYELCYKYVDAQTAHEEILNFLDQDLLFDFDTESYVDSWVDGDEVVILALNGKMMDDGLTEEEAILEYAIQTCGF